ncbi:2-hydroxychromene-2-carboxylate isomerase [Thauera linaloolentis]|uniref:2-hydroxychromene-2-carboxylate isomerase n=1 Tax=Thauera linaloolentis (strain DSM 12138 / JCM 21573 / CCUG 41526 / CIP 105981 / IAM 15112 / NBRC 102519 / 47Lol) TaxID=1123367 RepID=N6XXE3_THAL4|nr:DsbA family protein [Thauera linaloolentis]ENO86461.1 DsbA-like thioredoxin protein [Thauera linaloolentis 47Lol = DSM 12138]MCM8567341.1 DsbA family protein [Thauera linaloolentis]
MSTIDPAPQGIFYFDVVSPWACLMDHALRRNPLPVPLERRPVLFAGLLNAFGHKGPAEIERKRRFTYELCTWTAQEQGIPFVMPAVHPFNPLRYLRLIIALGSTPAVVSAVFDQLYTTGCDPDGPEAWRSLLERLGVAEGTLALDAPEVKARLKDDTARAAADGVFGVPTITVGERLFWGLDALPMLRACLRGDPRLESPAMRAVAEVRVGASRLQPAGKPAAAS